MSINEYAQKQIDDITNTVNHLKPLIVIRCVTYNHEPYIRDALEGFVMQKTNFPFVAIVHDDASTDGTAAIIREYAEKYPDIIKPIYETENQYSKKDGSLRCIIDKACEETGAKYYAMCEGDDYWTDPLKLQKQVDFLESNSECTCTFHMYSDVYENGNLSKHPAPSILGDRQFVRFDLEDAFMKEWITQPLTCVFRGSSYKSLDLSKYKNPRDIHLFYELLKQGHGCLFQFNGGVYRHHKGGVCSPLSSLEKLKQSYEFWQNIYEVDKTEFSRRKLILQYQFYALGYFRCYHKLIKPQSSIRFMAYIKMPIFLVALAFNNCMMKLKRFILAKS